MASKNPAPQDEEPFEPKNAWRSKTTDGKYSIIRLKLPLGWEQIGDSNVIELRLPASDSIPEDVIDFLKANLGEFSEMAIENLYKLNYIKGLKDAMV